MLTHNLFNHWFANELSELRWAFHEALELPLPFIWLYLLSRKRGLFILGFFLICRAGNICWITGTSYRGRVVGSHARGHFPHLCVWPRHTRCGRRQPGAVVLIGENEGQHNFVHYRHSGRFRRRGSIALDAIADRQENVHDILNYIHLLPGSIFAKQVHQ